TLTPTVSADQDAGIVVGLVVRLVRTVRVEVAGRAPVQVGTILESTLVTPAEVVAPALAQVAEFESNRDTHQIVGRVIPALLVVFAVVLLAFGLPKLVRRGATPPPAAVPSLPAARPPQVEPRPVPQDQPLAGTVPPSAP
ncbi:MAG TPA: hypothetical protein VIU11_07505, partial [Nakamurella sp.]